MRRGRLRLLGFLLYVFLMLVSPIGLTSERKQLVFFFSPKCPHCRRAHPFIEKLERKYSDKLRVIYVNVLKDTETFLKATDIYNEQPGVPFIVIGDREPIIGYRDEETTGKEIEETVKSCINDPTCELPESLRKVLAEAGYIKGEEAPQVQEERPSEEVRKERHRSSPLSALPDRWRKLLRRFTPERGGLLPFTVVIAALDSINPCAFFVLLSLLSLLLHARSRTKLLIVGMTFVITSGLIYFAYMAAWLNLFLALKSVSYVNLIAGAIALAIAVINVKDYFAYRRGVSLTISDEAKPKIFDRMRGLMSLDSLPTLIGATILLAITVNLYELLCTIGFPMVYTKILTNLSLPTWKYYAYLGLYNVVYVIPLLLIVLITAATLGRKKLTEVEGRILKLTSGYLMMSLAVALLFIPSALESFTSSIGLIVLALALTGLTYLLFPPEGNSVRG